MLLRLEMRILPSIYCGITNNTNIHFVQTSKHCEMLPKFWEAPQNMVGITNRSNRSPRANGIERPVADIDLPSMADPCCLQRSPKARPPRHLSPVRSQVEATDAQKSAKGNCIQEQVVLVIRNVNRCNINSCLYFIWLVVSTPLKILVNGKDYPIYYGK